MLAERHAAREHGLLGLHPEVAEPVDAQLSVFAPLRMDGLFEPVHGDLPEYGGHRVVDFADEQGKPVGGIFLARKHFPEGEHFAEDRGGFGGRQRRVGLQRALFSRQILMYAVAQFVRQRLHVARFSRKIQENVRMRAGHDAVAEGSAALAGSGRRVDPAAVEEKVGDGPHAGMESVAGGPHDVARLGPRIFPVGFSHRSVPVVVEQFVVSEQLALQFVEPGHEIVFRDDGFNERLHGFVLDLVGQIPVGEPGGVAAKPVVYGLVRKDGIEYRSQRAAMRRQSFCQAEGGPSAQRAIRFVQHGQDFLLGFFLSVEAEADAAQQFVEEAVPGAASRDGLLGHYFLFRLGEEIIPLRSLHFEVMSIPGQCPGSDEAGGLFVVRLAPFQSEKNELLHGAGIGLADMLEQGAPPFVAGIRGPLQKSVGVRLPCAVLDGFQLRQRFGHCRRREARDLASPGGPEGFCVVRRLRKVLAQGFFRRVQVGKIPADIFGSGLFFGHEIIGHG